MRAWPRERPRVRRQCGAWLRERPRVRRRCARFASESAAVLTVSVTKSAVVDAMTTVRCRRDHFAERSKILGRRAWIGWSSRNRRSSSANSRAEAYRSDGSFSIALRMIVSKSRGIAGLHRRGLVGSSSRIRRSQLVAIASRECGAESQKLVKSDS